ncbi:MAG TPA: S41 family peptidase [Planctomycetota bacterium]|nr:S41 family peptidase [Planctomycetota bacterium]
MRHLRAFRFASLVAALFAFAAPFPACTGAPVLPFEVRSDSKLSLADRRAIFADAWRTIGEKHFDESMGGLDWARVRTKYAPLVDAAATESELLTALNDMAGELGHSHVAVLPPERENGALEQSKAPGSGTLGLRIAWLDGRVVVTGVDVEGGAAIAGIRAADEIVSIEGTACSKLAAPLRTRHPRSWPGLVPYAVMHAMHGPVGEDVELEVAPPREQPHTVRAMRQTPSMPSMDLGNLGLLDADFESRLLGGNVLYVRFSPCFTPLQERFEAALEQARGPAGVVLDLRDNPGGLGALAMGVARHFLQGEQALGSMHMRDQKEPLRFLVNPVDQPYRGPVIVLVNGGTGSTAEILAAGLQKLGRVRVVGETSMGAALPSVVETIACSFRVQAVIADFTLPDGTSVEGTGVVPDVAITPERSDYAGGRDPFVEVALRELANAPVLSAAPAPTTALQKAPSAARKACEMDAETRRLFERMCAATRSAKLLAAKTLRLTSKIDVMGMVGPSVTTIEHPDKIHNTSTMAGVGEMLQVFDGTHGWSRNPFEGVRELTTEEVATLRRGARLDVDAWSQQFARLEIVEQMRDGERDAIVLRQTPFPDEGDPILVSIDATTLLPFRMQTTLRGRMGALPTVTEITDYAEFDGVLLPQKTVSKIGGSKVTTTTEKLELDLTVPANLFGKPARR